MLDAVASWPEREAGFLKPGRVDSTMEKKKYVCIYIYIPKYYVMMSWKNKGDSGFLCDLFH